jgi:hypothetical protein
MTSASSRTELQITALVLGVTTCACTGEPSGTLDLSLGQQGHVLTVRYVPDPGTPTDDLYLGLDSPRASFLIGGAELTSVCLELPRSRFVELVSAEGFGPGAPIAALVAHYVAPDAPSASAASALVATRGAALSSRSIRCQSNLVIQASFVVPGGDAGPRGDATPDAGPDGGADAAPDGAADAAPDAAPDATPDGGADAAPDAAGDAAHDAAPDTGEGAPDAGVAQPLGDADVGSSTTADAGV